MRDIYEYSEYRSTLLVAEINDMMASHGIKFDIIPSWLMKEQRKPSSCGYCILNTDKGCRCPSAEMPVDAIMMICEVLAKKSAITGYHYAFFRTSVMNEPHESRTRLDFAGKAKIAIENAKHDAMGFKRTYDAIRKAHA